MLVSDIEVRRMNAYTLTRKQRKLLGLDVLCGALETSHNSLFNETNIDRLGRIDVSGKHQRNPYQDTFGQRINP